VERGAALKKLEHYLERAIINIESDREITRELLDDVVRYLSKDEALHGQVGMIASKYVETLQRSNEQLVKVATLIQKGQQKDVGLSAQDKKDIFNLIEGEG
jgi:single-stranded DNA-specific DHH superfamily exonuclease